MGRGNVEQIRREDLTLGSDRHPAVVGNPKRQFGKKLSAPKSVPGTWTPATSWLFIPGWLIRLACAGHRLPRSENLASLTAWPLTTFSSCFARSDAQCGRATQRRHWDGMTHEIFACSWLKTASQTDNKAGSLHRSDGPEPRFGTQINRRGAKSNFGRKFPDRRHRRGPRSHSSACNEDGAGHRPALPHHGESRLAMSE